MDTTPANFTSAPSQQQYNVFAILGFVFAFIFAPLGLIFSIIAFGQIKHNPLMKGKGLAVSGMVLSVVFILFILAVLGLVAMRVIGVKKTIENVQLKLTDAEIISAAKEQQSLADSAYNTYKGYPGNTPNHDLDTRGLIGLIVGRNSYLSYNLFNPQGKCVARQDTYGYFPYKSLTNKELCKGGDKGDCQAYEIRFCLQQSLSEFQAGDNVILREGPPPQNDLGLPGVPSISLNNSTATKVGAADLVIDTLIIKPGDWVQWDGKRVVRIGAVIKNIGTTVSSLYNISFSVDDKEIFSSPPAFPEIEPNGMDYPLRAGFGGSYLPGWHTVKFVIKPLGSDIKAENNTLTKQFYVESGAVPSN